MERNKMSTLAVLLRLQALVFYGPAFVLSAICVLADSTPVQPRDFIIAAIIVTLTLMAVFSLVAAAIAARMEARHAESN